MVGTIIDSHEIHAVCFLIHGCWWVYLPTAGQWVVCKLQAVWICGEFFLFVAHLECVVMTFIAMNVSKDV